MAGSAVVRARIDERTKNDAAAVLATMGLTVTDAKVSPQSRLDFSRAPRAAAWRPAPLDPREDAPVATARSGPGHRRKGGPAATALPAPGRGVRRARGRQRRELQWEQGAWRSITCP
jgi:DNA-damage-inducible protein J